MFSKAKSINKDENGTTIDLFHFPVATVLLSNILEVAHALWVVGKFKQFEKRVMLEFTNRPMRIILEFC
jgi:hypothetical protein